MAVTEHTSPARPVGPPAVKPILSTMWSKETPLWDRYVDVLDARTVDGGLVRWLRVFLRRAKGKDALILRATVTRSERYRDLVGALVLKLLPGRTPRIVFSDATLDPGSSGSGLAERLLAGARRLLIRLADGPHVVWCVLSSEERSTFADTWGVDAERVVFTPFTFTLWKGEADLEPRPAGDYLWSGGNSLRDYDLLLQAVQGLSTPLRIFTSQPLEVAAPTTCSAVGHEEFVDQLAAARAVVVPIAPSVRSAGQQTYLNAMALGRVTIVTDQPGVRDHIEDGVDGVVVSHDPGQLRSAIEDVLDPARADHYAEMARRARSTALSKFSPSAYYERLLALTGATGVAGADR